MHDHVIHIRQWLVDECAEVAFLAQDLEWIGSDPGCVLGGLAWFILDGWLFFVGLTCLKVLMPVSKNPLFHILLLLCFFEGTFILIYKPFRGPHKQRLLPLYTNITVAAPLQKAIDRDIRDGLHRLYFTELGVSKIETIEGVVSLHYQIRATPPISQTRILLLMPNCTAPAPPPKNGQVVNVRIVPQLV